MKDPDLVSITEDPEAGALTPPVLRAAQIEYWPAPGEADTPLRVVRLTEGVKPPARATPGSACYDLYSPTGIDLPRGRLVTHKLGIKLALPPGTVGRLLGKSSLGAKGVLVLGGVIDCDYRGELAVILKNTSAAGVYVPAGKAVCQLAIYPVLTPDVRVVTDLDDTARGAGGFGSTRQ